MRNNVIDSRIVGNEKIELYYDEDGFNPRTDQDGNLCTMVVSSSIRYNIGDEQTDDLDDYLKRLVSNHCRIGEVAKYAKTHGFLTYDVENECWDLSERDYKGNWFRVDSYYRLRDIDMDDLVYCLDNGDLIELLEPYMVIQPISVYDHSGVTIWFGEPNDSWDSGCIGFGYQTKADTIKQQWANEDNWREIAEKSMDAEMEEYDKYVRGVCYYYILYKLIEPDEDDKNDPDFDIDDWMDDEDHWEEEECVGGFLGDTDEIMDEILPETKTDKSIG